jgi:hypothetical protein
MLCALEFDGRAGRIRFARATHDTAAGPRLEPVCETELN